MFRDFCRRRPGFLLTCLTCCLIAQFLLILHLQETHSAAIADLYSSFVLESIMSSRLTNEDHGFRAREIARLAHLADNGLHPTRLEPAVSKLFPWWSADRLDYFPWKDNAANPHFHKQTGIVICVGNGQVFEAAHLITTLRDVLGSVLPIQLSYAGDKDLSPQWRTFLMSLASDISELDLIKVFGNKNVKFSSWDTKPFAALAAAYPRTILMDSDALFFENVDHIFDEHPALTPTGSGTLFFHDRTKWWGNGGDPAERRKWISRQIAAAAREPSEYLTTTSLMWTGDFISEGQDSAVVMVDKSRPSPYFALLFAAWMNGYGPRDTTYKYLHGDKETYWLAHELTGIPFDFEPWSSARMAETPKGEDSPSSFSCTEHMVHSNADGTLPLFINDALWRAKVDPNWGFSNWTQWYLGKPLKETIADAKAKLHLSDDVFYGTELDAATKKLYETEILQTQPSWTESCNLPQPERWMPLPPSFRARLQEMIAKGETLRVAIEKEKASHADNPLT